MFQLHGATADGEAVFRKKLSRKQFLAFMEAHPRCCVARDDILCARMVKRGAAGLITDGVIRDRASVMQTGLPIWARGAAAPPSVAGLTFMGWQETVGCGGVCVVPGDVVVADADGAVVIPAAMVEEVAAEAIEQERMEGWIVEEVERGEKLPGLYPMNDATRASYVAWKEDQR